MQLQVPDWKDWAEFGVLSPSQQRTSVGCEHVQMSACTQTAEDADPLRQTAKGQQVGVRGGTVKGEGGGSERTGASPVARSSD